MVIKMPQRKSLKIEDFSRFPGGRERTDGPFSGEEYRESCIKPALRDYGFIEVDLRGAKVLIPSFVDEAFGPLIEDLGPVKFSEKVTLIFDPDSDVADTVRETIKLRSR